LLDLAVKANLRQQLKAHRAGRSYKVKEFFGDRFVTPAQAGVQLPDLLDSGLRRNDGIPQTNCAPPPFLALFSR
jgi:hypothetical protein